MDVQSFAFSAVIFPYHPVFIDMKGFKSFYSKKDFGRLLADHAYDLYVSCRVKRTSLAALVRVYNARSDYALYAAL